MASSSASTVPQATTSGDLADLLSVSHSTTVYPTDDAILAVLSARFRADLPYARIGSTGLVVLNPCKTLANVNDVSAKEYEEICYKDTKLGLVDSRRPPQPHVYELAAKIYLLMRRRTEKQAVIARGISGSGKTTSSRLLVDQILRLSSHSKREGKIVEQIKAFSLLVESFGNAKTPTNPNASRYTRYTELHFNDRGRISAAKILAFGLDKSRLVRLSQEERSYHVFYQLLAGATPTERDTLGLEGPSDYTLLASSGCYRLPAGPFSDDGIAMDDLRDALKTLSFKSKHVSSIFSVLAVILLLGNIEFGEADAPDVSAYVVNMPLLQQAAKLLGVSAEELGEALTYRTSYVRKELFTVLLNAKQSAAQRDQLVQDLYAILFAFVVETANYKLAPVAQTPSCSATQIALLDQAGFQTRGPTGTGAASPLILTHRNGFNEFCINFADEMVESHVLRSIFDDHTGFNGRVAADGISLPATVTMDNSACAELLRGPYNSDRSSRKPGGLLGVIDKAVTSFKAGRGDAQRDDELLQDMSSKFGVHSSFVAPTPDERRSFGINHYAGSCTYDISNFVERDADLLDPSFVTLLRSSSDSLVAKLMSGPSLSTEKHQSDEQTIVQAQVSSRPLRNATTLSGTPADSPRLNPNKIYPVTTQLNHTLGDVLSNLEHARLWTMTCIRPNDNGLSNSFDKRRVKGQIRALNLPDIIVRKSVEFVAEFDQAEFCERYRPTMRGSDAERIRQCIQSNGWNEDTDFAIGHQKIWLTYSAWKMVEDVVRSAEKEQKKMTREGSEEDESMMLDDTIEYPYTTADDRQHGFFDEPPNTPFQEPPRTPSVYDGFTSTHIASPTYPYPEETGPMWDKKAEAYEALPPLLPTTAELAAANAPDTFEEYIPTTRVRRYWIYLVRIITGLVPDFLLTYVGRLKRPDVRLAWREKVTICVLIFFANALVLFYIIAFGIILCPNFNYVWNANEVAQHTATNDFYVSIQGRVYDVSNFVRGDHSDIVGRPSNDEATLEGVAGTDMTYYFPPPLYQACAGLVSDSTMKIDIKNTTELVFSTASHSSGANAPTTPTALDSENWYTDTFMPKINLYYKGPLVWESSDIYSQANDTTIQRIWAIYDGSIYDLTDYVYTMTTTELDVAKYNFLDSDLVSAFQQQPGEDITGPLNTVLAKMDETNRTTNMDCLKNAFYWGETDFRYTARCQVQNYMLLAFSSIIMASMGLKFLAALQLGTKRFPERLDKFVLCQVPCYTEGEDSLRSTIDSLAGLDYDDKRKLIFVICDGNIIGSGNERATPEIVLDIFGVDQPSRNVEPLMFKSIGEGSQKLNYGKVFSGLYEFEGHVVPYVVIVKVGKPTERSKPGNRGKRDSQILLMEYLNRVHFSAPMSPLELEIYHQMRNIIGIDPAFYEYIFTVDADTVVTPASLNRLVAASIADSNIIGICGETKLQNEENSWWTMIQVYEYYISHHLAKAFESLFGSVSCLPGCFTLYRIRTADKGRPIFISNRVIDEYAESNVDTLHKKNLFSLGEDRFLTTLLMKHFPTFKTKFQPDAVARTMAPVSWRVLFSQRRRWINSTIHNLCELAILPELCGICCFSMRFFVYLDLISTLILPATVVYLAWLVFEVSTGQSSIPYISIAMIAAVYGLQALIFIVKREFMLVGWMVVYLISYPVYSFFLPIYSFWRMDEFGWGTTRIVVDDGSNRKVATTANDMKFNESMIPYKKWSDHEAEGYGEGIFGSSFSAEQNPRDSTYLPAPVPRHPSSQRPSVYEYGQSESGDYYRDTNIVQNSSSLNFRGAPSRPSSRAVSDYNITPLRQTTFRGPSQERLTMGTQANQFGGVGGQYGRTPPPSDPRMTMNSTMMARSMSPALSLGGPQPPFTGIRPISTLSMATTMFAGPSNNPNPSDEELYEALRSYLSSQDLMTVTKKTAREGIANRYPRADLASRKDFLNQSIDIILSHS
ncbi:glycosyltransferase family 2 protein [Paxillus rubicundulus Ve08.2h10]|uniref:chitin synthase n=1 Tax=Paxillus rubicundulus Ve08.2h10 TaxID=930991 RepID=A0A0D0DBL3_9AGAM|nr:glycosyltransferase family 2 protein [Paxillus rubicundulus Ve08.2h10]